MSKKNKQEPVWQRYKNKYRLSISRDNTLEEVFWMRLSRINIISILFVFTLVLTAIIFLVIAYTPVKEFIPGFPTGETRRNIILNAHRIDSTEKQLDYNQRYLDNIKTIMQGNTPINYGTLNQKNTKKIDTDTIDLSITKEDSLFRSEIESQTEFDLMSPNVNVKGEIAFFPPIQGVVTQKFNLKEKHLGADIAPKKSTDVFATFRGTVLSAYWTKETGFVVYIQHPQNLVSVYKHLEKTRVKEGDMIGTGKKIGECGNVGTLSTGSHLHFEIWKEGRALNPQLYIHFN